MTKSFFLILFVFNLLFHIELNSQYSSNYIQTNPYNFNIDDFNKITIISSYTKNNKVIVDYNLYTKDKQLVCNINFYGITLNSGSNQLNIKNGKIIWGKNIYAKQLIENSLSNEQYNLCVEIMDLNEINPTYENCFEFELNNEEIENVLNVTPIELLEPENKDTIKEIRPQLIWQPPTPTYQGTKYYLLLVELSDNLSCTESLNNNIPIIQQKDIIGNILNYPSQSLPLKEGTSYCWRVSAYVNDKEYTRSEDWKFLIFQNNKIHNSIPLIDELDKLHYILSSSDFQFYILNREDSHYLNINIEYLNSGKVELIELKNRIMINYGLNLISLPNNTFNKEGEYKITVFNVNNRNYQWKILSK